MYRQQTIEWDIDSSQLRYGERVGFEILMSRNVYFNPVDYRLTTYEENAPIATFYYSLDGVTWNVFPCDDQGMAFYQSYRMRLVVNSIRAGYIFVSDGVQISQISADGRIVVNEFDVPGVINEMEYDGDVLSVLSGMNLYRYSVDGENIVPYANSLNLGSSTVGVCVDSSRKTIWQLDNDRICLKNWHGEEIFCVDMPFHFDVEMSSSSSSSFSSESSSSSDGYSSSSSSSYSSSSSSSSLGYSSSSSTSMSSISSESEGNTSSSSSEYYSIYSSSS